MLKLPGLPVGVRVSVISGILAWSFVMNILHAQNKKNIPEESIPVTINIPNPVEGGHLLFGIPLGSAKTPNHVSVYDESGNFLEADVFPLQNWQSQNNRWALIAMPITDTSSAQRQLYISLDELNPPLEPGIQLAEMSSGEMAIVNRYYDLRISPSGISSISTPTASLEKVDWAPGIITYGDNKPLRASTNGEVIKLYDGNLYKKIRTVSTLNNGITVHQEYNFFANSPYIKCQTRFINTLTEDISLAGLMPLDINMPGAEAIAVATGKDQFVNTSQFTLHQGKHDWLLSMGEQSDIRGRTLFPKEWVALKLNNQVEIQWVFPNFQEMAAAQEDRESILSLKNGHFQLKHYQPLSDGSKDNIHLKKGMARTFTYWMIFSPEHESFESHGESIDKMPHVVYDLDYLSSNGLDVVKKTPKAFQSEVNLIRNTFQQIPPSVSIPALSNAYDIGGMSFGLYTHVHESPHPNEDLTLQLLHTYLSSSKQDFSRIAYEQALLQADWGVLHNKELAEQGFDYENPVAYPSFEGLLLGYLVWGDPWFMEAAQKKGREISPSSTRGVSRGQTVAARSLTATNSIEIIDQSSVATSLIRLADLTGEASYRQSAVEMVSNIQDQQEESGIWSSKRMSSSWDGTITTAEISQALWPLYFKYKDESLKNALLKGSSWLLYQQAELSDRYPGMFMEDTEANSAVLDHEAYTTTATVANILLDAFTATNDTKYFYASNAAWFSVVNQQPVDMSNMYGSQTALTGFPKFAQTALESKLPALIGIESSSQSLFPWVGMGNQISWDEKKFIFDLKSHLNDQQNKGNTDAPISLNIYFPFDKPSQVLLNGTSVEFEFDEQNALLSCKLVLEGDSKVYRVEVNTENI